MSALRQVIIPVTFLLVPQFIVAQSREKAGTFMVADSIETTFSFNSGTNGIPGFYSSIVFTPVCEGDKCYAIELELSWDLAGRYQGYDTLRGKGMTKLDHRPFCSEDYSKLHRLLGDPDSPLGLYRADELVRKQRRSDIDGLTGATLEEIRTSVVEGAVYSCHTLWHIVHGSIGDSIRKRTGILLSAEMFRQIVIQEDHEIKLFLIRSMNEEMLMECFPDILRSIEKGQGYYGKQALESIPGEILNYRSNQILLAGAYPEMDYFSRIAMLEKLNRNQMKDELAGVLSKQLDQKNTYENQLIKKLLDTE